ncbi:MAG TPA: GNAT family N-acetyltransferase [Kofleriaceae bacterium]|nr:GNAT family N-acetyltransferase [Kofleriaceae bacterium]
MTAITYYTVPMAQPVDLAALRDAPDEFDDAVAASPGIDRFCSSSAWIFAAHDALMGERTPWMWRTDSGWLALARRLRADGGVVFEPLELAWGLASPLVGPDPPQLARELLALAADDDHWDAMLLAGIAEAGPADRTLIGHLPRGWRWGRGTSTQRYVASLEGGVDGFLGRRSRNLRKALRVAQREAAAAGIELTTLSPRSAPAIDDALRRIVAIERRSWKGKSGVGVDQGPMLAFYNRMSHALAPRGRLRLIIAQHEGRDVAFILGGVFAGEYRGLQFSFDNGYRSHGLGNLLQLRQIEALVEEGIGVYDLGTAMPYKERWAETVVETRLLVIAR